MKILMFNEFKGVDQVNEGAASTDLDELAKSMVGDGKSPNVFFVSVGMKTLMATTDGDAAHDFWSGIKSDDKILEDRKTGAISGRQPGEDGGKVEAWDDYKG